MSTQCITISNTSSGRAAATPWLRAGQTAQGSSHHFTPKRLRSARPRRKRKAPRPAEIALGLRPNLVFDGHSTILPVMISRLSGRKMILLKLRDQSDERSEQQLAGSGGVMRRPAGEALCEVCGFIVPASTGPRRLFLASSWSNGRRAVRHQSSCGGARGCRRPALQVFQGSLIGGFRRQRLIRHGSVSRQTCGPHIGVVRPPSYCPESGHMIIWRDEAEPCKSRFGNLRL